MKKISVVSIIVIFIDRIIKLLVEKYLKFGVKNKIIDNFFYLTFCKNEGAAFSIFDGQSIFLVLVAVITIVLLYKFIKDEKNLNKFDIIRYGLLIGGIIGNFIDRIFYGYVIDYLDFKIFSYNYPIFNFADMCIVVGAILLLVKGSDNDGGKNNNIDSK